MGGSGSGVRPHRLRLVEECLVLSAAALRAAAFPDWPAGAQPTLTWSTVDGSVQW